MHLYISYNVDKKQNHSIYKQPKFTNASKMYPITELVYVFTNLPEPFRWTKEEFVSYSDVKRTSKMKFELYSKALDIAAPKDKYYKAAGCHR